MCAFNGVLRRGRKEKKGEVEDIIRKEGRKERRKEGIIAVFLRALEKKKK